MENNEEDLSEIILEIESILQEILSYVNTNIEVKELTDLFGHKFYVDLFIAIFSIQKQKIEAIVKENENNSAKIIQGLIDLLTSEFLSMDLSHITGVEIAINNNLKHIQNFLQIIKELNLLLNVEQDESQKQLSNFQDEFQDDSKQGTEWTSSKKEQPSQKSEHQAYKKDEEMKECVKENEEGHAASGQPNKDQNHHLIEFNRPHSEIQSNQSQQQNVQQPACKRTSQTKQIRPVSGKQKMKQEIEKNMFGTKKQRFLTNDPNAQLKVTKKRKKHRTRQNKEESIQTTEEQQQFIEYINSLSFQDYQNLQAELGQLQSTFSKNHDESDPAFIEFQNKLRVYQALEQRFQQEFREQQKILKLQKKNPLDFAVQQAIQRVKENQLQQLRYEYQPLDMKNNDDIIIQQRKNYKQVLEQYYKNQCKKLSQGQLSHQFQYFNRGFKSNQDKIQFNQEMNLEKQRRMQQLKMKKENFELQQQKVSVNEKLKSEKYKYLQKIKNLIFDLEKEKLLDEKKQNKRNAEIRNQITQQKLKSIQNEFQDKIRIVKENLVDQNQQKKIQQFDAKKELQKIENQLKDEKAKQLNVLKSIWNQEQEKIILQFDAKDLEEKVSNVYKKY